MAAPMPTRCRRTGAQLLAAERHARLGESEEAIRIAADVLAQDPKHLGALELTARAQWKIGEYESLLATLRQLVATNPYEPGYHALRGSALQCLGRYGEATMAMERAKSLTGQREALAELREWQAGLIADLIDSDPIFRTHYRQDPVAACAQRGFHIAPVTAPSPVLGRQERAALYTRPS